MLPTGEWAGHIAYYNVCVATMTADSLVRDSSSTKRRLLGFLPTHPLGLYSMTISLHGRRISLDCIEFSDMLLATTAAVLLQYYYSSKGNCTPGYRGGTAL